MSWPVERVPGWLALADGAEFSGNFVVPAGRGGEVEPRSAEVVFNTAMSGYQEVMTDPSYFGQMVCFSSAYVGNYGVNPHDDQSASIWLSAVLAPNYTSTVSNFTATASLASRLFEGNVPLFVDLDTRRLVKRIRDAGALPGVLAADLDQARELLPLARGTDGQDLASAVSTHEVRRIPRLDGAIGEYGPLVVVDYGVKNTMVETLRGPWEVVVVPAATTSAEIRSFEPSALFLSNGPGDPGAMGWAVRELASLLGELPIAGICLGHQLLAQVAGARTFKLPFGHHGSNHPVRLGSSSRVAITAQNHNYAVDEESLSGSGNRFQVTHRNLFDGVVEGLSYPELRAFSVQYHPEASPGPHEARGYMAASLLAVLEGKGLEIAFG